MNAQTRTLSLFLLICAGMAILNAQTPATASLELNRNAATPADVKSALKQSADNAAKSLLQLRAANPAAPIQLNIGPVVTDYLSFLARTRALKSVRTAAETARSDKQVSASSSSSSGSTSVVDKPGIPQLLAFAVEHGAITQAVQNNTVTFSTSPYAIAAWLNGADTARTYEEYGDTYGRLGFSANFNLSDSSNPTLSATRKQLHEWTAKVRLGRDHSARSQAATKIFNDDLGDTLQTLANDQAGILSSALGNDASYVHVKQAIFSQITQYLQQNPTAASSTQQEEISRIIADGVISGFNSLKLGTATLKTIEQLANDYDRKVDLFVSDSQDMNDAIADLEKRSSTTFVYAQEQPTGSNNYSVLKLVFAKGAPGDAQITLDVSGSLYHHPNAVQNQSTFRDFNASLEWLQKFGRSPFLANPLNKDPITMSFDGSYQRMPENEDVPGKKADIAIAGITFQIPIAAGVSFPISVTYANATELIKEAHVSGNFGITFDLDKLSALISH